MDRPLAVEPLPAPAHPPGHPRGAPASTTALDDPLRFLTGTWSLERRLRDDRLGQEGRFVGLARVEPAGGGRARYEEEGVLEWPGYRGRAFRGYALAPAGRATVAFSFPDGRPFHLLQLRAEGYAVVHDCAEDRYLGTFFLDGSDRWRAVWRVEGPHKRLLLEGGYRRLSG